MKEYDLIVVGGGAAGFFTAIRCKERNPGISIIILEKSNKLLSKVRISGGGRCNVTHACFEPAEMVENYPRGKRELLGPFNRFLCGDMMAWLCNHGIETKIEEDGRVFPVSDSSDSIIELFLGLCKAYGIEIRTGFGVDAVHQNKEGWEVSTNGQSLNTKNVLMASGSSKKTWSMIEAVGHSIVPPVPSLFTFNIKHPILKDLMGLSVPFGTIGIDSIKEETSGPILITHWGLSGPAVLKMSAIAARQLAGINYQFDVIVNWTGISKDEIEELILVRRKNKSLKKIINDALISLPKRLWKRIVEYHNFESFNYHDLSKNQIYELVNQLCACRFEVNGKSTFKDEFVTAGGVDTKEVDFRSMQSKKFSCLFFAGEILNIDAVTGGFNFQACWTEGYIAADAIAGSSSKRKN